VAASGVIYMFRHLHCHPQGAFLVPSERCSVEEQSIEYCGGATATQLSISQKALGTLPEDGNVIAEICRSYHT
jgi:hypothetical protein